MIAAVTLVKDELDIIEVTLRRMAAKVDYLLVSDNLSTDGTRELVMDLITELPNVEAHIDSDPAHYHGRKMTALAGLAARRLGGHPWIVPFDADETWTGLDLLRDLHAIEVVSAPGWDHRPTHDEGMPWRERVSDFRPKVAFQWHPSAEIAMGNHAVTIGNGNRSGRHAKARNCGLRIHHYPIRSVEQFIRKARNGAAAIAATDMSPGTCAHWRRWGEMTDADLEAEFLDRYFHEDPETDGLVWDPV